MSEAVRDAGTLPRYEVYGVVLATDLTLVTPLPATVAPADVVFDLVDEPLVAEEFWDGPIRQRPGDFALYRTKSIDVIRFVDEAVFFVCDDRIACMPLKPGHPIVEIRLLGGVLAYWLESRGMPTLHASAVVIDGSAVAFTAGNGGGKTSLAAELMRRGHPMLTDDILPLELRAEGVYGLAGYPQMRMWPDEAQRFVGDLEHLTRVHPAFDKLRVPVGSPGLGSFCDAATPVAAIYLLNPVEGNHSLAFEPVPPQHRLVLLAAASFAAPVAAVAPRPERRLETLGRLASHTPVWRLSYGRDGSDSNDVAEAVLSQLSARVRLDSGAG